MQTNKTSYSPSFIIAGAQKCATTSLYAYLDTHPEIFMSPKKQIHFFDNSYNKGYKWYEKHFSGSYLSKYKRKADTQIAGEATPSYMLYNEIPERIYKYNPNMKLIFILRNPVSRAWSQYTHECFYAHEDLPFMEALKAEEERIKISKYYLNHFSYKKRGCYAELLDNYLAFFPKEQIYLLLQENLYQNPIDELNKIASFLGCTPKFIKDDLQIVSKNSKKEAKYRWISKLANKTFIEKLPFLPTIINSLNSKKQIASTKISEEEKVYLNNYFSQKNIELEKHFSLNLSIWKK